MSNGIEEEGRQAPLYGQRQRLPKVGGWRANVYHVPVFSVQSPIASFLLSMVLSISACSSPKYQDSPEDRHPLVHRVPGDAVSCPLPLNVSLSPSYAEEPAFRMRIKQGLIRFPVNIRCVKSAYTPASLAYWAKEGDPVAIYAQLYKRFDSLALACPNLQEIEDELSRAGSVMLSDQDPYFALVKRRLPEAYLLIGQIRILCEQPEASEYYQTSARLGYVPIVYQQVD